MKQVFLLVAVVVMTQAYPEGAPVEANPEICNDMFPSGHNEVAQTVEAPYTITADASACCKDGDTVTVVVKSIQTEAENSKGYFEGVFIQARPKNMSNIVGTFSVAANTNLKTVKCSNDSDSATQSAKAHYFEKTFTWHPPSKYDGEVEFVATIVHETEEFWVMHKSEAFKVKTGSSESDSGTSDTDSGTSGADFHRVQPVLLFGVVTFILAAILH